MAFLLSNNNDIHMKTSLFLALSTAAALSAHGAEIWSSLDSIIPELKMEETSISRIDYSSGGALIANGGLPQMRCSPSLEPWMRDGIPAIRITIPVRLLP